MSKLLSILLILCSTTLCYATSIVFAGFGRPLIHNNKMYAYHVNGLEIICLDLSSNSIKWRTKFDHGQTIHGTQIGLTNEIIVSHRDGLSILDADTGKVREKHFIKGRILILTKDNQVVYEDWQAGPTIHCHLYKKNKDLWVFDPEVQNSNISSELCKEYIFIFVRPRGIVTSLVDLKEETNIGAGSNEIICLKASNGSLIWRERVPLSKAGHGLYASVKEGKEYILCVSDNAIRLLDKASGKELKRYITSVDIDGADFWGDDCIVVCLGGKASRTIRVIDIADFRVLSEFKVWKREVASVESVDDILLLRSYSEMGVDLVKKKTIWTAYQRHQRIHNSLVYYGGHREVGGKMHRVIGICEPITGRTEILYSEPVK